jgi:hypothetical protein
MTVTKRIALGAVLSLSLPWILVLALRLPRGLPVDVGPGDRPYTQGLHADWRLEEDGTTWREMELRARLHLPVSVEGPGQLVLIVAHSGPAEAVLRVAFDDETSREVTLASSRELRPVVVEIPSARVRANVRLRSEGGPLRVAGVRFEGSRPRPQARLVRLWLVLFAASAAAFALGGLSFRASVLLLAGLLGALVTAAAIRPFAFIHWVGALAGVSLLGLLVVALARFFRPGASVLALLYLGVLFKSATLLHPSFYFADMPIHETLLDLVYHRGVVEFWRSLPEFQIQYRLGLSPVGDDYQPYPYSVLFYYIAHLGNRFVHSTDFWLKATFGVVCALPVLPIGYLARKLSGLERAGFLAGVVYLATPAYTLALLIVGFSSLLGHFLDLLILAFLVRTAFVLDPFRRVLALTGLVLLSLAAYNSGFISIGLFFASVLVLAAPLRALDRRSAIRFALAGLSGAALALLTYHPTILSNFLTAVVPQGVDSASTVPSLSEIAAAVLGRLHMFVAAPIFFAGAIGIAGVLRDERSPGHRLLVSAWVLSGLVALTLRYTMGELLRHEKEMYWIAALLALGAGVLLARLLRIPRWGKPIVALVLAVIVSALVVRFWSIAPSYYDRYRFF